MPILPDHLAKCVDFQSHIHVSNHDIPGWMLALLLLMLLAAILIYRRSRRA
jgi:hypothetical protein